MLKLAQGKEVNPFLLLKLILSCMLHLAVQLLILYFHVPLQAK